MPKVAKPKTRPVDRDNIDKIKPCGYEGFCPMVDEMRLFQSEVPYDLHMSYEDRIVLTSIAINKWCKKLAANNLKPRCWPTCQEAIESAAREMIDKPANGRTQAFIVGLYKAGSSFEKSETMQVVVGDTLDEILDRIGAQPF